MNHVASELLRVAKLLVSSDQVIATNNSVWSWEDDYNEKKAILHMEDDGKLRLEIIEVHEKYGIGAGRSVATLETVYVGTVAKPRLGIVPSILKKHGHDRTNAGGPFKRLWKDFRGNPSSLVEIVGRYAQSFMPKHEPVPPPPVDKRKEIIQHINNMSDHAIEQLAQLLKI